jgi:hypothetical protein
MDRAPEIQKFFGQGCLTGIWMRNDSEGTAVGMNWHRVFLTLKATMIAPLSANALLGDKFT